MSQEQKNRLEQAEGDVPATSLPHTTADASVVEETQKAQGEEGAVEPAAAPPAKRRVKRKTRLVSVDEISPRPSYWPLALAFSLAIVLFGIIASPVVVAIGVILAIASVIGWILERR
ncbi:MAG: hypothetical protein NVS2B12_15160 [Ktedonobacteraceae bacterium]